jgi:hypothetical protein
MVQVIPHAGGRRFRTHSLRRTAYASGVGTLAEGLSIIPITSICAFAVTAALAFINVQRPEVHRRLLILTIVTVVDAPLARLTRPLVAYLYGVTHAGAPSVWTPQLLSFAGADIFLLAALINDLRTLGRLHPVNLSGGAAIVLIQCLREPISKTAAWHSFVHHFLALTGNYPSPNG